MCLAAQPGALTLTADDFLTEARALKKLRHPKILTLHAVCTDGEPFLAVVELMNCSLLDYLHEGHELNDNQMIYMCEQVAAGTYVILDRLCGCAMSASW